MTAVPQLRFKVTMRDGTEHEFDVDNPALVAYEMQAANERWPGPDVAPLLWQTSVAYWQMVDDGILRSDLKANEAAKQWAQFRQSDCRRVEQVKVGEVDPTRPDPESGSQSPYPSVVGGPSTGSTEPPTEN